jgi:hypothetical protein
MKAEKVPVTVRALVQRINRTLGKKGEKLLTARGEGAREEVGDYYVINVDRNILMLHHVNLEALGRELDVLKPWETLTPGG